MRLPKTKIIKAIFFIALISQLFVFLPSYGQTLNQEYRVKNEYKNCNVIFDREKGVVRLWDKEYKYEESYYSLKYAVLKNGDYVCLPDGDLAWDYLVRICIDEYRYRVHIGNQPFENGRSRAIWILRKR